MYEEAVSVREPGASSRRLRTEAVATAAIGLLTAAVCWLLVSGDPRFFWHDDYQIGGVPYIMDMRHALLAGEWPLLTPYSWVLPSFAAEYQMGVFNPVVLAGAALTGLLGLGQIATGTLFSSYLLVLTSMGGYRLARTEGLAPPLATMVALVAAFNGWNIGWAATNWIPAAVGFTTLVWCWWALARSTAGPQSPTRLLTATAAVAGVMASGWPHTIFMMLAITLWLGARAWARGGTAGWWLGLALPWALGVGLSAPAWLCFLEFLPHTFRSTGSGGLQTGWLVPPLALPGLTLPTVIVEWSTFSGRVLHVPLELTTGLVPAAAALWSLRSATSRRAVGWELGLTVALFTLACLPSLGMFRWSFRWLPVAHLALALLAARGLQTTRPGPDRASPGDWRENPGVFAAVMVALTHTLSLARPVVTSALGAAYLLSSLAWAGLERARRHMAGPAAWALPAITAATFLATYRLVPVGLDVPHWPLDERIEQAAPLKQGVRYIALVGKTDYFPGGWTPARFGTLVRPGLVQLVAGVEFINGYSAMYPRGAASTLRPGVHGYLDDTTIHRTVTVDSKPGGLLDRIGVDGIILSARYAPMAAALDPARWRIVTRTPDGLCVQRVGPASPMVRSVPGLRYETVALGGPWWRALMRTDGISATGASPENPPGTSLSFEPRATRLVAARRNSVEFQVEPGRGPAVIAVMRAWTPGWEARLAGRTLPVMALDGLATGVEVPAGQGGLVLLRYRPWGLTWGPWVAASSVLTALVLAAWLRRRKARPSPASGAG
jgi:hypothetical protein